MGAVCVHARAYLGRADQGCKIERRAAEKAKGGSKSPSIRPAA
jgi:hypothetical protein